MKEIALTGTLCRVYGDVLTKLLEKGLAVNAMIDNPEHLMIDNCALTITHLDLSNRENLRNELDGYTDCVMVFDDDLSNAEHNDFALRRFHEMVNAATEAGVKRLIVVASPDSTSFFAQDLRRRQDIDWLYISTENAFPERVYNELVKPTQGCKVYEGE